MIKPAIHGRAGQRHRWNPCRPHSRLLGLANRKKGRFRTLLSVIFKLRNFETTSQR